MSGLATSQEYKLYITVEGQDNASGPLGGVSGALGRMGEIAGGIIGSRIFLAIVDQIKQMGAAAIQATADYQQMSVGIETLVAREISRGTTVQQMVTKNVSMTDQEKLKLIELGQKYDDLTQQISDTSEQYEKISSTQGSNTEEALRLSIQLQSLKSSLSSTSNEMQALKDKSDGTVVGFENVTTGAMTISEALPQAEDKAKKLLNQIRLLAIQSPFSLENVQTTFKQAMAFGFASDEAMSFTKGILNVAAGVGASNETMDRMAYNLAQIRMVGKVSAIDVRQLAMAGFDLNGALQDVSKQFGYTINDYNDFNKLIAEGKITWADFATAFEKYSDTQFGGASQRLSQTWNGMMSNFNDVFALTMPSLLGPALEKVTGFMNGLMEQFLKFTESGKLEEVGQNIGNFVGGVIDSFDKIDRAKRSIELFFTMLSNGASSNLSFQGAFNIDLPKNIDRFFDTALGFFRDVKKSAEDSKPAIDAAFKNFAEFWEKDGDGIVQKSKEIFDVYQNIQIDEFKGLTDILSDLSARIMPWFAEQAEKVSAWFKENGPLIQSFLVVVKNQFENLKNAIDVGLVILRGAFQLIWAIVEPILTGLVNLFLGVAKIFMQTVTGDWAGVWETFKALWVNTYMILINIVTGFFDTILGWFGTSFEKIGIKTGEALTKLKNNFTSNFSDLKALLKEKFDAIVYDAKTWVTNLVSKITEKITEFKNAGRDLIQGMWDGMKDRITSMLSWLSSKMQEAINTAKRILGISSPSKVFFEIGKYTMEGFGRGVDSSNSAEQSIDRASSSVTRRFQSNVSNSTSNSTSSAQVIVNVNGTDNPDTIVEKLMSILRANGVVVTA